MTRFEQEFSGALGTFWKANAEKEIRKMEERQINGDIFFGTDGVVRWKRNGRVMPKDSREILAHTCYRDLFDEEASTAVEKDETAAFLNGYMRNSHEPSFEEMAEMRSVFGDGAMVVDVLTEEMFRI